MLLSADKLGATRSPHPSIAPALPGAPIPPGVDQRPVALGSDSSFFLCPYPQPILGRCTSQVSPQLK